MVVRALRQRAVALTYGQRALVIGALHPRLFVGTAQHTEHRETPYTRLGLTARLFEAVFLGSTAEADRALQFAAKRHAQVRGTMDVDGGARHPLGAPYSAADPGLMWWTAAFTLDSVEFMYDALVRRLRDHEREELFEGFVRWAELSECRARPHRVPTRSSGRRSMPGSHPMSHSWSTRPTSSAGTLPARPATTCRWA